MNANDFIARLVALLDLPEDATPETIFGTLHPRLDSEATPDPLDAVKEMMRKRATRTATLSAERA
ncbi:hypothetical protein [Palleronia sp.]|uniref:hypothetical protein n=1 Tax=Palleronia sp. TaxID=1940284 RepID=UPI0035C7D6DC